MRSERIHPFFRDDQAQFHLPDRFDDHIDIGPELFVEQSLNSSQIDEIEPRPFCRSDNNIHIAPIGFVAARDRTENGSMDDPPRLKRRAKLPKDCEGLIALHETKIRHTRIKFTWKRKIAFIASPLFPPHNSGDIAGIEELERKLNNRWVTRSARSTGFTTDFTVQAVPPIRRAPMIPA